MAEDFARQHLAEVAVNKALMDINEVLLSHNTSCRDAGLPEPNYEAHSILDDTNEEFSARIFQENYSKATEEQKHVIDAVINVIICNDPETSRMFYLDAPAGCGKTYVQETLRSYMRSQGRRCIVACYTGIAASLIDGGRTLHNVFKLPVPLLETSVPNIDSQSAHAAWLRQCELIIIDEASMVPAVALSSTDCCVT